MPQSLSEYAAPGLTASGRKAEWVADAVVHVVGLAFGLAACIAIAVLAIPQAGALRLASLGLYGFGLLAMLGCSALYNLSGSAVWKGVFRRLDHAAIFLMIAGTYSPFALIVMGGGWGIGVFLFVWAVALCGVAMKLLLPMRFERLSVAIYLLLGWTILVAFNPLVAGASMPALVLLLTGGGLYSLGVIFHLWERLPYQNAIWHVFVLAAAACHFTAILLDVAIVA